MRQYGFFIQLAVIQNQRRFFSDVNSKTVLRLLSKEIELRDKFNASEFGSLVPTIRASDRIGALCQHETNIVGQ